MNYCLAMGDSKMYTVSYGLEELWKLSAYPFLSGLVSYAEQLQRPTQPCSGAPKFIHYAAHAETLSQFFDGLGIHRLGRSFPSSAIIFEFLKVTTLNVVTPAVRMVFYDGETQREDILRFPGQTQDVLSMEVFARKIIDRLNLAGGSLVDIVKKC